MRFWVLWLLLLVLMVGSSLASKGAAHLYNEANALYRKGRYDVAAARYEDALAGGIRNAEAYYNLGNAYYKTEQIGRAVLAYERALRVAPGDEDVQANLRFVNALKVDQEEAVEANVATRFLTGIYRMLSADAVAIVCSLCVFLLAAVAIGWIFRPDRKAGWVGAFILIGVVELGAAGVLVLKVQDQHVEEAIVLSEEVVGRSGPGTDFLQVFTLHEGTKVIIERGEGKWVLVRLGNGIGGWVEVRVLEKI